MLSDFEFYAAGPSLLSTSSEVQLLPLRLQLNHFPDLQTTAMIAIAFPLSFFVSTSWNPGSAGIRFQMPLPSSRCCVVDKHG